MGTSIIPLEVGNTCSFTKTVSESDVYQFGGITGDLAGWFLQITELTLTAVIVIGGKLL